MGNKTEKIQCESFELTYKKDGRVHTIKQPLLDNTVFNIVVKDIVGEMDGMSREHSVERGLKIKTKKGK